MWTIHSHTQSFRLQGSKKPDQTVFASYILLNLSVYLCPPLFMWLWGSWGLQLWRWSKNLRSSDHHTHGRSLMMFLFFYRDYEWCNQEGEEEGRMEGKKQTLGLIRREEGALMWRAETQTKDYIITQWQPLRFFLFFSCLFG